MELSDWFKGFEKGIARLPSGQREAFFAECGKNCVEHGTLQIYRQLYETAHGDLDGFFLEAAQLPGVRTEIVRSGSEYHLYFTECTCGLHRSGYVSTPLLCECSRQSILYVLGSLWEDKVFGVEICGSILRGDGVCKMKIEVGSRAGATAPSCTGQEVREYRIRPLAEHDIPQMKELFRSTVLTINSRDYTLEEVEDWASCGDSEEHWKMLLSENCFFAALDSQGNIIGFASMDARGHLHSMFVHKDWQGRGAGACLLSEAEDIAREYGVARISSEVSITARPFFERHGYKVVKEQEAKANRLYLKNYVMEKAVPGRRPDGIPE